MKVHFKHNISVSFKCIKRLQFKEFILFIKTSFGRRSESTTSVCDNNDPDVTEWSNRTWTVVVEKLFLTDTFRTLNNKTNYTLERVSNSNWETHWRTQSGPRPRLEASQGSCWDARQKPNRSLFDHILNTPKTMKGLLKLDSFFLKEVILVGTSVEVNSSKQHDSIKCI